MSQDSNKQLFKDFQPTLLKLANDPYFRKELWIESPLKDKKIIGILPNAVAYEKEGKIVIDFTCSDVYAKRLNIIAPMVEQYVHNPIFRQHANFLTFTSDAGGDGYCNDVQGSFATARADTSANNGVDTGGTTIQILAEKSGSNFFILRGFIPFDTSSIGSGATILSATLTLNIVSVNTTGGNLYIVASTQASGTTLVAADYGRINFVAQTGSPFDGTSLTSQIQSLNATGLSNVSKTGVTKFAILFDNDFNNNAPAALNGSNVNSSDNASNKPTLTVLIPATSTAAFLLNFV